MNVEHPTSNVQHRIKKQTSNTEHSTTPRRGFFSAVLILVTKILINSSVSSSFSIQHSMLDVRCSMFIFLVFDVHSANKKIPKRIKRLGIYLLLKHELYGRSSDFRINLILAPSRPVQKPSQKFEITYRNKSVARCEFRSRSQRRVRTGV